MNRRLYRSRTDTVLGGVAAGLASYLNTDPAFIRVAWVVVAFVTNGAGVLAYLVAWVVMPEEPAPTAVAAGAPSDPDDPLPATGGASEPTGDAHTGYTAPVEATDEGRRDGRGGLIVGVALVLLGVWLLVREYLPPIDWGLLWPIVLIGIGGVVLLTSARRRG